MLFCILQTKELKVFVLNYLFKIVQRTVLDEIVSPSRAKVQNNKDNFSLSVLLLIIVLYKRFRLPKLKFLSFKANPLVCVGVTWSSSWWPLRKRAGEQVKLSLLYPLLFFPSSLCLRSLVSLICCHMEKGQSAEWAGVS